MKRNAAEFVNFLASHLRPIEAMYRERVRFGCDDEIAAFLHRFEEDDKNVSKLIGRMREVGVLSKQPCFQSSNFKIRNAANQRKLNASGTALAAGSSPKLINIDLLPYQTVQACERADILNIGGFSDAVFNVISAFLENDASRFVREVECIEP